ncbi:hypothetical protein [Paractinoplanes durhamensis]|uniref:ABC transporter permease n=1 Tax=Paractinoplanes durhamensis TaxID=113563 RepID=A0ABQ3YYZ6_9ACTN|nr:hypothetical protein [Actinoplanes durhamensis]GIE02803.1 hypothetical protein Adu01nite_41530 [Actinoplanes durhamensis]
MTTKPTRTAAVRLARTAAVRLARTTAAELVKLRGLPAILGTALGTVVTGAFLAVALASSAPTATDATDVVTHTVLFLQIGPILIGVLAVATEYAGRQIATTLTATPNRRLLLAGKAAAYLIVATATSVTTIVAGLAAAQLTLIARDRAAEAREFDPWPAAGAVTYLVLIGVLALALATLLRSLIPPLVGMLTVVLVVSPLLSGYTEHARWLPDRAGGLLYLPTTDPVLGARTGTIVLLTWIALTGSAAIAAFRSRDA